jgi:hypothetical protein
MRVVVIRDEERDLAELSHPPFSAQLDLGTGELPQTIDNDMKRFPSLPVRESRRLAH